MVPKAHHCTDGKKTDHKRRQKAVRKAKGRQTNTKTIPPIGLHYHPASDNTLCGLIPASNEKGNDGLELSLFSSPQAPN